LAVHVCVYLGFITSRNCFSSFHNNSTRRFAQDFGVGREFTVEIDSLFLSLPLSLSLSLSLSLFLSLSLSLSLCAEFITSENNSRFFTFPDDSIYYTLQGILRYRDRTLFQGEIDFWRTPHNSGFGIFLMKLDYETVGFCNPEFNLKMKRML